MKKYDVYAIGNALVDSEFEVSNELLEKMLVQKHGMTLIDEERKKELLAHIGDRKPNKISGGSAGNTIVALSQFGGKGFISCCVANDEDGIFYFDDLRVNGVDSSIELDESIGKTGSCLVFVTPDAARSMTTHLGVSAQMNSSSLNEDALLSSEIYYMEGYLAASKTGLAAVMQGRIKAKNAGVKLALTLSDRSMIQYCKDGLLSMLGDGVDFLFCNEDEAKYWTGETKIEEACHILAQSSDVVCLTLGEKGCLILNNGMTELVGGYRVKAVDTTGAGDMFSGVFLRAVLRGDGLFAAVRIANYFAAQLVAQHGPRFTLEEVQNIKKKFLLEENVSV
jgi:sugar/nucleoside kinase (ribokinase family)